MMKNIVIKIYPRFRHYYEEQQHSDDWWSIFTQSTDPAQKTSTREETTESHTLAQSVQRETESRKQGTTHTQLPRAHKQNISASPLEATRSTAQNT